MKRIGPEICQRGLGGDEGVRLAKFDRRSGWRREKACTLWNKDHKCWWWGSYIGGWWMLSQWDLGLRGLGSHSGLELNLKPDSFDFPPGHSHAIHASCLHPHSIGEPVSIGGSLLFQTMLHA